MGLGLGKQNLSRAFLSFRLLYDLFVTETAQTAPFDRSRSIKLASAAVAAAVPPPSKSDKLFRTVWTCQRGEHYRVLIACALIWGRQQKVQVSTRVQGS